MGNYVVVDLPAPCKLRTRIAFGLGFSIMMDVAQAGMMGSVGDRGWGGYAETYFWADPRELIIEILMTQYLPSLTYPNQEGL